MSASLYTDEEITAIYHRHVDMVYRLCYSFMKNTADTEDMVQETFLKVIHSGVQFQSEKHEKAWLIVTASNTCKSALRYWGRKTENIEDIQIPEKTVDEEDHGMLEAVFMLPVKYRTVVYLYYYEGYATAEIAKMLRCPKATVRTWLVRARKLLKKYYSGGDGNEKRNL